MIYLTFTKLWLIIQLSVAIEKLQENIILPTLRTWLFCIINATGVDDLVMQRITVSAAIMSAGVSWNIIFSTLRDPLGRQAISMILTMKDNKILAFHKKSLNYKDVFVSYTWVYETSAGHLRSICLGHPCVRDKRPGVWDRLIPA